MEENDRSGEDALLERAVELMDEARFEDALELMERLPLEHGARWLLTCDAQLELGDGPAAERAFTEARRYFDRDDADLVWLAGRLHLHSWRIPEARAAFQKLDAEEEGAPLLENLALLADLDCRYDESQSLLRRARRQVGRPAPIAFEPEAFERLVADAASELPAEFRRAFEEVAVVIDPMPTPEIVGAPESGHPPDLLGLFVGIGFDEPEARASGELPPTIFLFQRNLERISADPGELQEEVRTTLFHELGHALGFDEHGVEGMGLA